MAAVVLVAVARNVSAEWSADEVDRVAELLSERPYEPSPPLTGPLAELNYDTYRLIQFAQYRTIWRGAEPRPFQLELSHRGYIYPEIVALHLVEDGVCEPVPFDWRYFEYRGEIAGIGEEVGVSPGRGYAGWKMLARLPGQEHMGEVLTFLGSSYFRGLSAGQVYGASCRGLAIDVGMPRPEEFPVFRAFWIEQPEKGATSVRCHAVLDSHACTGAYHFVVTPGENTSIDVDATLHFRHEVGRVGLAPMSSMWWWGYGRPSPDDDPRPEVHDSDGLLVLARNEGKESWVWRPLGRPEYPSVSRVETQEVLGFGLLQRQRDPARYNDPETRMEDRPSIWIEPKNPKLWGAGGVELLEFPTEFEGMDNIAAWWSPGQKPVPGEPFAYGYRITFPSGDPSSHRLARATAFTLDQSRKPATVTVDFTGPTLIGVPEESLVGRVAGVRAVAGSQEIYRLNDTSCRLTFQASPETPWAYELSASLARRADSEESLSEVWSALCPPQP